MTFTYELTRVAGKSNKKRALRHGNEMINSNDRLDPHTKADLTAHLRSLSTEIAKETYGQLETKMFTENNPCYIGVIVCPPTTRRMDAPNWYPTVKALIDGLTDAGVFKDDNNKIITSVTFIPGPVTTNKKYRIEIVVREGVDNSWRT